MATHPGFLNCAIIENLLTTKAPHAEIEPFLRELESDINGNRTFLEAGDIWGRFTRRLFSEPIRENRAQIAAELEEEALSELLKILKLSDDLQNMWLENMHTLQDVLVFLRAYRVYDEKPEPPEPIADDESEIFQECYLQWGSPDIKYKITLADACTHLVTNGYLSPENGDLLQYILAHGRDAELDCPRINWNGDKKSLANCLLCFYYLNIVDQNAIGSTHKPIDRDDPERVYEVPCIASLIVRFFSINGVPMTMSIARDHVNPLIVEFAAFIEDVKTLGEARDGIKFGNGPPALSDILSTYFDRLKRDDRFDQKLFDEYHVIDFHITRLMDNLIVKHDKD